MTPERMAQLFVARADDYAVQLSDGRYQRAQAPLTTAVLQRHLSGDITAGAYQLDQDGNGRWLLLDLDVPKREWLEQLWQAGLDLGIPASAMLREFSGSKGFHLWVFTAEPVPGELLQQLGDVIADRSNIPLTDPEFVHPDGRPRQLLEIYPKTTQLARTAKNMGQLVKLPLGIHRKTGKLASPLDVTGPIVPLTREQFDAILEPWANVSFLSSKVQAPTVAAQNTSKATVTHPQLYPCTIPMMEADWSEGGRNQACFLISKRLHVAGHTNDQVVELCLAWNREHCHPPMSDAEVTLTARSGCNYTGMDCLNPVVVPFCKTHCPIYKREHPAVGISENGEQPKLKVTSTVPAVYFLPLRAGTIRLEGDEIYDWRAVRVAQAKQIPGSPMLPARSTRSWEGELQNLMLDPIVVEEPDITSPAGAIRDLIRHYLGRAGDEPSQVERHSVWLDAASGLYVFRGDGLLRHVLQAERGVKRAAVWEQVKEMGGKERQRRLPDTDKHIRVWEVPVGKVNE